MAIFRSRSKNEDAYEKRLSARAAAEANEDHLKMDTANIHDPILKAVNEAQPFEEANGKYERRPSYLSQESDNLKDIFGQVIRQPDMLNPGRSRNERPLDTIRGFEYAITGDMGYRDQLESNRLGWGFHEDFPYYNLSSQRNAEVQEYSRPVASFSGEQPMYQAGNYSASSLKPEAKKKKRGLFGRKKKE